MLPLIALPRTGHLGTSLGRPVAQWYLQSPLQKRSAWRIFRNGFTTQEDSKGMLTPPLAPPTVALWPCCSSASHFGGSYVPNCTWCITKCWIYKAQFRDKKLSSLTVPLLQDKPHNETNLHGRNHMENWFGTSQTKPVSLVKMNHALCRQCRGDTLIYTSWQPGPTAREADAIFVWPFTATFTTKILPHAELWAGWMRPAWSICLSNLLPHVFKHFTCRKTIKARRLNMDVQSLIDIPTGKLGVFYL